MRRRGRRARERDRRRREQLHRRRLQRTSGSWPSIAYLRGTYHDSDGQAHDFACTGSVISPQWIVTAGHCTVGEEGETVTEMVATLGVTDYTDPAATRISVDQIVTDPSYQPGPQLNDVGMVHLATPTSQPAIPIATTDQSRYSSPPGVPNAAGWGATDEDGTQFSPDLQQAYLAIHSADDCSSTISGFDPATQTCAGTANRAGACFGDSGGPLVEVDSQTGKPALWGVTSYGPQSGAGLSPCSTEMPAVYSWIPAATDFINSTIANGPPATTVADLAPVASPADDPSAAAAQVRACKHSRAKVKSTRTTERRALTRLRAARRQAHTASYRSRLEHRYKLARSRYAQAKALASRRCD